MLLIEASVVMVPDLQQENLKINTNKSPKGPKYENKT
jgi:hypothetical protein